MLDSNKYINLFFLENIKHRKIPTKEIVRNQVSDPNVIVPIPYIKTGVKKENITPIYFLDLLTFQQINNKRKLFILERKIHSNDFIDLIVFMKKDSIPIKKDIQEENVHGYQYENFSYVALLHACQINPFPEKRFSDNLKYAISSLLKNPKFFKLYILNKVDIKNIIRVNIASLLFNSLLNFNSIILKN